MHYHVIALWLTDMVTNVNQSAPIESESVSLIDHVDPIRHALAAEETMDVRHEFEEFFETISKRNDHGEAVRERMLENADVQREHEANCAHQRQDDACREQLPHLARCEADSCVVNGALQSLHQDGPQLDAAEEHRCSPC